MSAPPPDPSHRSRRPGPASQPYPTGSSYATPPRGPGGTPAWAKLVSVLAQAVLVLSLVVLAAGLAGQVSRSVARIAPVDLAPTAAFSLGLLVVLGLIGLVNRLSAAGSLVIGAMVLVLGLVTVFSLDVLGVLVTVSGGLPSGLRAGVLTLAGSGALPLLGGLLMSGGLGTALARRAGGG